METSNKYDVIIIGGSYAGLSAAMALGRAIRKVLVLDNGKPCNEQTPHSHNFLTQDGKTPREIADIAKQQVTKYETITFVNDTAVNALKTANCFQINTAKGNTFEAKKIIFASGIKDELPNIEGFADCWGISVIHCPYCHGYEVRNQTTGILANGDNAYEFAKLIWNWSKDLTLFTNGKSMLSPEQTTTLQAQKINIIEKEITKISYQKGQLEHLIFTDGTTQPLNALYAKLGFKQNTDIPMKLGCELSENGYLKVNMMQQTNIEGVFACGDNTNMMRSVANAVYSGNMAGTMASKELIAEEFNS